MNNLVNFWFGVVFDMLCFKFGFDFVVFFDCNVLGLLLNLVVFVGGEVRFVKWLVLNVGYYGGGVYKNSILLGVMFILKDGKYEVGVVFCDIFGFVIKNVYMVLVVLCFVCFCF